MLKYSYMPLDIKRMHVSENNLTASVLQYANHSDPITAMLKDEDEAVRTWAASRFVMSARQVDNAAWNEVLQACARSGEVRRRTAKLLVDRLQYARLDALFYNVPSPSFPELMVKYSNALRVQAFDAVIDCLVDLFMETINPPYLMEALELAMTLTRGDEILRLYRTIMLTSLKEQDRLMATLLVLINAGRKDERERFYAVAHTYKNTGDLPAYLETLINGHKDIWSGEWQSAIERFKQLRETFPGSELDAYCFSRIASAHDKLGCFRNAAAGWKMMNQSTLDAENSCNEFITLVSQRLNLLKKPLEEDYDKRLTIMTGFPRSGTTLLENALSANPAILTIEESSALDKSFDLAYKTSTYQDPACEDHISRALAHRRLYQTILCNGQETNNVDIIIDKSPISSVYGPYLKNFLPISKFIFSLRHPYDVVWSCFKQEFQLNIAMRSFVDLHSACTLYDYAMKNWFRSVGTDPHRVFYVRYEELINRFEVTISGVQNFLGVPVDDSVLDFAGVAERRASRTPSYTKVRQGLALGVQSSYQNYLFLFDDYCRSKLDPWVEFFGYTVEEPEQ